MTLWFQSNKEKNSSSSQGQSATEIMLVLSTDLFKKEKQERKPRTKAEIFCLRISKTSKEIQFHGT